MAQTGPCNGSASRKASRPEKADIPQPPGRPSNSTTQRPFLIKHLGHTSGRTTMAQAERITGQIGPPGTNSVSRDQSSDLKSDPALRRQPAQPRRVRGSRTNRDTIRVPAKPAFHPKPVHQPRNGVPPIRPNVHGPVRTKTSESEKKKLVGLVALRNHRWPPSDDVKIQSPPGDSGIQRPRKSRPNPANSKEVGARGTYPS